MKIKYLGPQRRDGSYHSVQVDGESVWLSAEGVVDVPNDVASDLLATGEYEIVSTPPKGGKRGSKADAHAEAESEAEVVTEEE